MTLNLRTLSLCSLAVPFAALTACGLDRPVEQEPLVSVVDEWRQEVLAQVTVSRIDVGDPVEVSAATLGGDLGDVSWDGRLDAEATGTMGDDLGEEMAEVSVLAGGGQQAWGMAILGFVMPPHATIVPGTWTEVQSSNANVVGCTGQVLFDWTTDESASATDMVATRDATDPALVHFEFRGEFVDGRVLEGAFSLRLPEAEPAPIP